TAGDADQRVARTGHRDRRRPLLWPLLDRDHRAVEDERWLELLQLVVELGPLADNGRELGRVLEDTVPFFVGQHAEVLDVVEVSGRHHTPSQLVEGEAGLVDQLDDGRLASFPTGR